MNSVSGQAAGWAVDPGLFSHCQVVGCGQYCGSPDIFRSYVEQRHIYAQHPGRGEQSSKHGPPSSSKKCLVCSFTEQLKFSNIWSVPITSLKSPSSTRHQQFPQTGFNPSFHASTPVQQQVPNPNLVGQLSNEQNALSETIKSWPAMAHTLLKNLIITHGVFTVPQNAEEHDKLVELFEKFHADTKTLGMNIAKSDEVLWQLFTLKVGIIQAEILAQGELISTAQGLVCRKLPQKISSVKKSRQGLLSTPRTTPLLSSEQSTDGLDMWNSMDGNAQAQMLQKMLRAVKESSKDSV